MQAGTPPQQRTYFLTPQEILAQVQSAGDTGATDTLDDQIGFLAYGLIVDNPTAQWWHIQNLDADIPPYTLGIQIPIPQSTQVAQVRPIVPVGVDAYHPLVGQQARFIFKQTGVNAPFAGIQTRVQPHEIIYAHNFCPD